MYMYMYVPIALIFCRSNFFANSLKIISEVCAAQYAIPIILSMRNFVNTSSKFEKFTKFKSLKIIISTIRYYIYIHIQYMYVL